jgi:hypothetical protein
MISFFIRRRTALLCLFISYFSLLRAAAYTPPDIRSLNGDNISYLRVGTTVVIDVNSNATLLAGTAPDFNRALLTVTITQGLLGEDSLSIRPITSGTARITLQGRKVLYNGVIIGTYQPVLAWTSLTVRFNERASAASITAVIRSLAYTNLNAVNPVVATRVIRVAVSDGYGSISATSVVRVDVIVLRPAPVATNDYYRVPTGQTSLAIPAPGVLKNDYHPAKGSFESKLTRDTPVGHVVIGRDGSVQYTPQAGSTGTYSATYTTCDTWGLCSTATLTFRMGGENEAPQAIPDYYHIQEHQGLFINNTALGVLGNDIDPNSGTNVVHTATLVSPPTHGTMTFYPNGTFMYHPVADYRGTDTFVYRTCDAENACAEGIVTITIADVDYPPYAPDIILAVPDTTLLSGNLIQGVLNYDQDRLEASMLTEPAWGTLVFTGDSTFSYISRRNQEGIERLLYQVCDGKMQCDTATLVIVITNSNSKPVVSLPAIISVREDTPTALSEIVVADADAGNSPVRVTFEALPTGSALTAATLSPDLSIVRTGTRIINITGPIPAINTWLKQQNLLYTPVKDATTGQSIRVTINDQGNTGSGGAQQTVVSKSVVVIPVNDAPVNNLPGNQTMKENEQLTFTGSRSIRISDVDASGGDVMVTLTATRGVLATSLVPGENNTEVSTVVLTGRLDSINTVLATLVFRALKPGAATLTVTTNDLGNVGEGGPQTTIGTITIAVIATPPVVTRVTALSLDGLYKAGDRITLAVQFNHAVWVSRGTPSLALAIGEGSQAAYQGGSGTPQLLFDYTVQVGDLAPWVDYATTQALALTGATIQDSLATDAVLTLPSPGSKSSLKGTSHLSVDGVPPAPPQLVIPAHNSSIENDVLILAGISEAGTRVLIALDANPITTVAADAVGGWDYEHDAILYVGRHTITLQATDSAGNVSDLSQPTTIFIMQGAVVSNEPSEHLRTPRAYPVPADDVLFIDIGTLTPQTPIELQLVDSRGVIHTGIFWKRHEHVLAVDISSLGDGLYVLLLTKANEQYSERILIVKK